MESKYSVIRKYNNEVILVHAGNLKAAKERGALIRDAYYLCTHRWITHKLINNKWVKLPMEEYSDGYAMRDRQDSYIRQMGVSLCESLSED